MARKKKVEPLIVYDADGNEVGVILEESEFLKLMDRLEGLLDSKIVQERKKKKEKTYTHEEIVAETLMRMGK
jgi:hypothetical protein